MTKPTLTELEAMGLRIRADERKAENLPLTDKQRAILDYYGEYIRANHVPPSRRDVQVKLGFTSPSAVQCHIKALLRKGYMRHANKGAARSVVPVTKDLDFCPTCGRKL